MRGGRGLLVAAVMAAVMAPAGWAQITLREDGFRVRTFDTCGEFPGPESFGIVDAVCSEGGAFGEFVYYTVQFPPDDFRDHIQRISMQGKVEPFADARLPFNSRLVISPPESFAGERMFVFGDCGPVSFQGVFRPDGGFDGCLDPSEGASGPSEWDRSGLFNFNWYSNTGLEIVVFEGFGSPRPFAASTGPGEVHFGPGGVWGRDLYVADGGVVDPNGAISGFPFRYSEWAWLPGPGWNGDMFDLCGPGQICRVQPDGTVSVFASDVAGGRVVGCGGHLWIMASENCLRITPRMARADTRFIPPRVRLAARGGSFMIRTVLRDAATGEPLNPDLMGPAWISSLTSPALGEVVLPVPDASPGCDDATDDGIWESLDSRVNTGSGSVALRFNTPSDGSCETMDGDLGDILPLLAGLPNGEAVSICFNAESPEVVEPVEGCGFVTVSAGGGGMGFSPGAERRQRLIDRQPQGRKDPDIRRETP